MQFFALLNGRPTIFQGLYLDGGPAAPSIAFINEPTLGFYRIGANGVGFTTAGAPSLSFFPGGEIYGAQGSNRISIQATGAISLTASGTNQDVQARPSGAGRFRVAQSIVSPTYTNNYGLTVNDQADTKNVSLGVATNYAFLQSFNSTPLAINPGGNVVLFGKETNSANGFIQLADHTSTAGGIGFGADISLSRSAASQLDFTVSSGAPTLRFMNGAVYRGYVGSNGSTTVLNSQSGDIQLQANSGLSLLIDTNQNATFSGAVITMASVAAKAGLRLPHGAAPTAPVNGDVWTTTAGLFVRINGATVGPLT